MKESVNETEKRRSAILNFIRQQGSAEVNDLAARFCTITTVSRSWNSCPWEIPSKITISSFHLEKNRI